jgi:hypothetical protein
VQIAVGDIVELKNPVVRRIREVPAGRQGMVTKALPNPSWLRVQAMSERRDGTGPGGLINFDVPHGDVILRHRQRTLEEVEL